MHILAKLIDRAAIGGGANDEATGRASLCAQCMKCPLQPLALFIRANLA